ncbi:hypothetical protein A2Z00_01535 [Candidatus Gottesmanbacteria bacterium RBG_13_45_10]|uniref:DUF2062 domain-containing protein n=1 Tax=Candidatus Gottesmanbacteria bacterium RBG_13_45_10 TaxID=1798370 RepID=A0A1F5ZI95_9BACT|nr:MAG: hypothetical protein A2Z00_01535 [Candidatus Gottesmanbacteria bacterium RBG_13_45_10]
MKGKLNAHCVGVIFGSFLGLFHLAWALMVALGFAQTILDWIYMLHFLNNPFRIAEFNVVTAATLVIFTAVVGYVVGWVFAMLWNMAPKNK